MEAYNELKLIGRGNYGSAVLVEVGGNELGVDSSVHVTPVYDVAEN